MHLGHNFDIRQVFLTITMAVMKKKLTPPHSKVYLRNINYQKLIIEKKMGYGESVLLMDRIKKKVTCIGWIMAR